MRKDRECHRGYRRLLIQLTSNGLQGIKNCNFQLFSFTNPRPKARVSNLISRPHDISHHPVFLKGISERYFYSSRKIMPENKKKTDETIMRPLCPCSIKREKKSKCPGKRTRKRCQQEVEGQAKDPLLSRIDMAGLLRGFLGTLFWT